MLFELGARPQPPRDVYRAYLAQSDVFVGLYWQRYGEIAPGTQVSGLEEEFELSGALPRLLYVKAPAPDRESRLADLLYRIQAEASASYRHFRTPAELSRLVRDDLAVLLSERFAGRSGYEPRRARSGRSSRAEQHETAGSGSWLSIIPRGGPMIVAGASGSRRGGGCAR